jgi:hypothetical protein
MRTPLGVIVVIALATLISPPAQAHDRGGKSGVSFGIVIKGGDDHYGRLVRHHWHDPYYRHGYGRHPYRGHALHGCHVESHFGYYYGRRAELGRTVCYDRFGRRVMLAGPRVLIRYLGHY